MKQTMHNAPVMRSRRSLQAAAIAALAAMLFAQAAFALAVCDPGRMPSRAQVLAQTAEQPPCHEPVENVNLCLAHCQSAEQTLDKHKVELPALSPVAVLTVRAWHRVDQPPAWAQRAPTPAAGPPPRILYRSLLI